MSTETRQLNKKEIKHINDANLGTGQYTDTDLTKDGKGKHVRGYSQLQEAILRMKHHKVDE